MSNTDEDRPPSPPTCASCDGSLIPTQVESKLYVRKRGDSSGSAWSTTALEAWTCLGCGRTDLFACEPNRLIA